MNQNEPAQSVREIFAEALEIVDPDQRARFLAQACGTDVKLRRDVDELLQAEANAGLFLPDQPGTGSGSAWRELAHAAQSIAVVPPVSERPGDRIGRYELLEQIGEGGCGVVYRAQQETPVRRQVALKIIKLGMDTRQVIARFEAERQALALMDHPHIAKVLDAGATESGRPFFVMELVSGNRITDYCDQHKLSTAARLELFIQVCQAVQHAHQKGIIHRDLKPSNILVTGNDGPPIPKVIDFGIAKATEGKLTDQTLFTAFEQLLGTPAYMSPEQAAMTNVDIDTRSDIYSLGVLLYELLTGITPFDTKQLLTLGVDELRRTIREKEAVKPSTRLARELATVAEQRAVISESEKPEVSNGAAREPHCSILPSARVQQRCRRDIRDLQRLIPQLRGDLDWIVMKCLEKDRARRYETANGLAADLRRHLTNEPVLARPPSRLYEFRKSVRRHKAGFAAAAAVMVALFIGAAVSTREAIRATRAGREQIRLRGEAEAQAYTSEMNLAYQAWQEGNLRRAVTLLTNYFPIAGHADLRGFEWRFLWDLCRDGSRQTLPLPPEDPMAQFGKASSPAHSFVAVACQNTVRLLDLETGRELEQVPYPNAAGSNPRHAIALAASATNLVAVHRSDGIVGLWDLAEKRWLMSFSPSPSSVASIALSPDGQRLAVGAGATLALWDVSSRSSKSARERWSRQLDNNCRSLRFSPDGRNLVADAKSTRDGYLYVWDVETGQELPPFPMAFGGYIWTMEFSPDGSLLAYSGVSTRISVLDFARRTVKFPLDGHLGTVTSVRFSADSERLISTGLDGTIRLWDLRTGNLAGIWRDPHESGVWWAAFAPRENTLFSLNGSEVKIWNAEPRASSAVVENEQEMGGPAPAISPSGRWLVTTGVDKAAVLAESERAKVWNLASRQQVFHLPHRDRQVAGPVFSPDGKFFALGSQGRVIGLWETADWEGRNVRALPFTYLTNKFEPGSIAFSPNGKIIAAAGICFEPLKPSGSTNRLAFWEVGSWKQLDLLPGAGAGATEKAAAATVAFSPDGRWLAIGSRDGWVRLWDFQSRRLTREFQLYQGKRRSYDVFGALVAFSADGRWLAACSSGDRYVSLLDLSDPGQPPHALPTDHHYRTWSFAFSPDSKSLLTAGNDGFVRFWNLRTFEVALALRHGPGHSLFIAISRDGTHLVSQASQGTLRFWTAPSLAEIDQAWRTR